MQTLDSGLDRDKIDGAIILGRAIGHEAGLNRFGLPAKLTDYAPIIIAAGMTPAQRAVLFRAAYVVQTGLAALAGTL